MRPQPQGSVHPFDLLAGIVLGVGEVVVEASPAEGLHQAVVAPAFAAVKVGADQVCQILEAGRVGRRRPVPQMLALAPAGRPLGVMVADGPRPAFPVVQQRRHRPVEVAGLGRQGSDEVLQLRGALRPTPARLVEKGADPLLRAHLEDLAELGLELPALVFGQLVPGREQRLRAGLAHPGNVQFPEQAPALEVAGQQPGRDLPEETPGRVVPAHRSGSEPFR